MLENGSGRPFGRRDGWLNRAIAGLNGGDARLGLSLGPSVPLILQGAAPVQAWSNEHIPDLDDDFLGRLDIVYRADPLFSTALREARGTMQPDMAMMADERDTLAISAAAAAAMLGRRRRAAHRGDGGAGLGYAHRSGGAAGAVVHAPCRMGC